MSGLHRLLAERARLWAGGGRDRRSRAWRARCRAWSAASSSRPSSRCRRASATAPASAASRRCSRCSTRARPASSVVNVDNGFGAAAAAVRITAAGRVMADITRGRARRTLSVGSLTYVGRRQLPLAGPQASVPVGRARRRGPARRRTSATPSASSRGSTELRGAFMKLVQMLSMRHDLFPAEALERAGGRAVAGAADAVRARARACSRASSGRRPRQRFARFEPEAFAAASLGQVHRADAARRHGGRGQGPVPGRRRDGAAGPEEHPRPREGARPPSCATSCARTSTARRSCASSRRGCGRSSTTSARPTNAERFRRAVRRRPRGGRSRASIASSARSACSRWSASTAIRCRTSWRPGSTRTLRRWVAEKLFRILWRQVLEFGVLHADPHPGNYLVTPSSADRPPRLRLRARLRAGDPARLSPARARAARARRRGEIGAAATTLGFVEQGRPGAARRDDAHHLRAARARRAVRSARRTTSSARGTAGDRAGARAPASSTRPATRCSSCAR